MFNNISYKKRFYSIIILFVIVLLASYKKTYQHVFFAKKQLDVVEQKLQGVEDSNNQISILQNEISIVDNIIGGQTKDSEQVQHLILDFVSKSNNKINVYAIDDTHIYHDEEFTVYTNSIELQGDYVDLTKLLFEIENLFNYSKVISAQLYTIKDYRNNSKNLYLKLIFQNYEKNI